MSQLPEVFVEGTLTADPELRFTQGGAAVANVNIACNTRRKNPNTDQWEDGETTFVRGSIWKQLAENAAESLSKGDRVIAKGVLKQNNFEDKQGNKRTTLELEINSIGPSLRFATASVQKSAGGGGQQRSSQPASGWDDSDEGPDWS